MVLKLELSVHLDKASALKEFDLADQTVNENDDLLSVLGENNVDAVVDLVGGSSWPQLLDILRPGGKYVTSGAIAGPIVDLDLRSLYLKDLTLFGLTVNDPMLLKMSSIVLKRDKIKPLVAQSFPLKEKVIRLKQCLWRRNC